MKYIFLIFITTTLYCSSLIIDKETNFYDVLPKSQIYIDKSKSLKIEDILSNNINFQENEQILKGFGYAPDFNVWVKIVIINEENDPIYKILEYANALTANIEFYSPDNDYKLDHEGFLHIKNNRQSINPSFELRLDPKETKTYYLNVSSSITTLIVKLNLWNVKSFYEHEIKHQVILSIFFGAMLILGFYNLFIFFFTKDYSYLFYVLYLVGIIAHHLMYIGMAYIYILDATLIEELIRYSALFVAFPTIALAFFTKIFLQIKKYKLLNTVLTFYTVFYIISMATIMYMQQYNSFRGILSVLFLLLLFVITIYVAYKKNRQAFFILFGWAIFLTTGILMYVSSAGIFSIYKYFPYYIETSLLLEAVIFSIALSDRIKQLQKDKSDAQAKLIEQIDHQKEELELKVAEKTHHLTLTLNEKDLLLKELNHRVKNNMQTIISLIRLQSDDVEDEKIQDLFITIQNRIQAMKHLHELLYKQENISYIDTSKYFNLLIDDVRESYDKDITIRFNIETMISADDAIYCGLIVNELFTNTFKYAFPSGIGIIQIDLKEDENKKIILSISDDGIGYDKNKSYSSLGLILIDTIVKEQLKGEIITEINNGVKVTITWSNNE